MRWYFVAIGEDVTSRGFLFLGSGLADSAAILEGEVVFFEGFWHAQFEL